MFLFSCLTQRTPFAPDFLISLINARFYWHISSASCHTHQKLWNVRSLFEPPLSPHICRGSTILILPGSWLCFLNAVPLHTRCICFPLRREACMITLPFPLREMYYTQMTQIFWSTSFQRDTDLLSTISKEAALNLLPLLQLKEK